jgi:hypothetical protein
MGAKVIQVIETVLERRGSGKDNSDPIRIIRQYWSFEGELLAEVDPIVCLDALTSAQREGK